MGLHEACMNYPLSFQGFTINAFTEGTKQVEEIIEWIANYLSGVKKSQLHYGGDS